jgi:hypothetical protein
VVDSFSAPDFHRVDIPLLSKARKTTRAKYIIRQPGHGTMSNVKGKSVALIGSVASGIQVTQTIGPVVSHLTVFQRTPNYTLSSDGAGKC